VTADEFDKRERKLYEGFRQKLAQRERRSRRLIIAIWAIAAATIIVTLGVYLLRLTVTIETM
jgi:hypothetical protein